MYDLLQERILHRSGPVRVLLLARPAGAWWASLATWIEDNLDAPADAHPLPPLADGSTPRKLLFAQACRSFASHLGLESERVASIRPPAGLDSHDDYAQVLTIHIAALASVDALAHRVDAPVDPARASAYLLKRERLYWDALHRRTSDALTVSQTAMGRIVFTASLTRPLSQGQGRDALRVVGLADTAEVANTMLADHQYCYPPTNDSTVLEPLYPDRLGEDFIALTTPGHSIADAVPDSWADQAAARLLAGSVTLKPTPWTSSALMVLIETARRWPHIATGQLYPLIRDNPRLAVHAGSAALVSLANFPDMDPAILAAIESHLPPGRDVNIDVGAAMVTSRVANHMLKRTQDPEAFARICDVLVTRLHYAGMRAGALTIAQKSIPIWRDLTRSDPAKYRLQLANALLGLGNLLSEMGYLEEGLTATEEACTMLRSLARNDTPLHGQALATALSNLGAFLAVLGRRTEALSALEEAVSIWEHLEAADAETHEPAFATTIGNLSSLLLQVGRQFEALALTEEVVPHWRRLADADPASHKPDLGQALNNLGVQRAEAGLPAEALNASEEAASIWRQLAAINPIAHEAAFAAALTNLGSRRSEAGRPAAALMATEEAAALWRELAGANPAAHQSGLARVVTNLGVQLSRVGRQAESLVASEEAAIIWQGLAASNPDAHEPDFSIALNNLGIRRLEAGLSADALAASLEAVIIRRRLTASYPDAHLRNLLISLTNLSRHRIDREAYFSIWEDSIAALEENPVTQAAIRPHYASCLALCGEQDRAIEQLSKASIAAEEFDSPTVLSEARSLIRKIARGLEVNDSRLPAWATDDIPDGIPPLLDQWIAISSWVEYEGFFRALTQNQLQSLPCQLSLVADLLPDRTEIRVLINCLARIDQDGLDGFLRSAQEQFSTNVMIWEWVNVPTWEDSEDFFNRHIVELMSSSAKSTLASSDDPDALTHLAIIRLANHLTASKAYKIVTDRDKASELALYAVEVADLGLLRDVLAVNSQLLREPTSTFYRAITCMAAGDADSARRFVQLIVALDSDAQRRSYAAQLRSLIQRVPGLAEMSHFVELLHPDAQP
ncbi:tetratricopeptide repeat protein [Streptomyces sp. NPDC023588]|uniref:tetratricopeptide repeat protein n=1 Tax=Streptomyces sp. NPDC023588 TaxID=3154907 RepID=UPI0034111E58